SAFTTRGICSDILREVLIHQELLVCHPLLDEVKSVLLDKFNIPNELIKEITRFLNEDTIVLEERTEIKVDIKDTDDIVLLGYALSGKATFFVTGDKELQKIKKLKSLRIISPREYWELIRTKD
ncbi:MAG: putative toxin-antitoxin system toxin component, PIN family, partial [bacterium]